MWFLRTTYTQRVSKFFVDLIALRALCELTDCAINKPQEWHDLIKLHRTRTCTLRATLTETVTRAKLGKTRESLDMGNKGVNFVSDTDCVHCSAFCEIQMLDLREVRSL